MPTVRRAHRVNITQDKRIRSFWILDLPLPAELVNLVRDVSSESVVWTCPEPPWRTGDCPVCEALHNLLGEAQDDD